jgi:hypothetical protein
VKRPVGTLTLRAIMPTGRMVTSELALDLLGNASGRLAGSQEPAPVYCAHRQPPCVTLEALTLTGSCASCTTPTAAFTGNAYSALGSTNCATSSLTA